MIAIPRNGDRKSPATASPRKYPSGAEKRRRRKEREEAATPQQTAGADQADNSASDQPTAAVLKPPVRRGPATFATLPLRNIMPHPSNPRRDFAEAELQSLADSLNDVGLVEPIVVRHIPRTKDRYELIAGERRLRAAAKAGWKEIPAVVRDVSDAEAITMQLIENLQRVDLNPIEVALGLAQLCRPESEGGAGRSTAEVGALVGKSEPWARQHIALLRLPPHWQQRIAGGEICKQGAMALIAYVGEPQILARIETDMQANPWSYRIGSDFVHNIKRIAEETGESGNMHPASWLKRATQRPPQPSPADRRPAATAAAGPEPDAVDGLVAAIAALADLADVERVLAACVERRDAMAANGRRRLGIVDEGEAREAS